MLFDQNSDHPSSFSNENYSGLFTLRTKFVFRKMVLLVGFVICAVVVGGCSKQLHSVLSRSAANIYDGAFPDAHDELYKSSVWIEIPGNRRCSGVLVSNNSILTAGHCVDFGEGPTLPTAIHFFSSDARESETRQVSNASLYPAFKFATVGQPAKSFDIAIIRFLGEAPRESHPVLIQEDFGMINRVSKILMAGTGDVNHFDRKMHFRLGISRIVGSDGQGYTVTFTTKSRENVLCSGDSGGGAYFKNKLIGIASLGSANCDRPGVSTYTFVPRFKFWIKSAEVELDNLERQKVIGKILRTSDAR